MVTQERLCTVEEFAQFIARAENRERRFELIHGEIVEKMPTHLHALIAGLFVTLLNLHVLPRKLGWVLVEARYQLPGDAHNARVPDVSFVTSGRGALVTQGPAPYMPDLAIEIQSPDQGHRELQQKADYDLAHGSRMVWLVYPDTQRVEVRLPNQPPQTVPVDGTLDGGEVLPGFTLPLREIFREAA